jgi:uncharacterized protein YceH (UPF0502 family)
MHDFAALSQVEETLEALGTRDEPLVTRLERQPGQKEARYAQLLGGPVDAAAFAPPAAYASSGAAAHAAPATVADAASDWAEEDRPRVTATAAGPAVASPAGTGAVRPDRVAALEERLTALEAELAILQAEHRELRAELGLEGRPPPGSDSPGSD